MRSNRGTKEKNPHAKREDMPNHTGIWSGKDERIGNFSMKYLALSILFLFGDEIMSLLALSIIMLMAGHDLINERINK